MNFTKRLLQSFLVLLAMNVATTSASANGFREQGKVAIVAKSGMTITPPRDWNQLSMRPGKKAETWTLDGELLNDVTFYGGIAPNEPLIREVSKKRDPLPKVNKNMLLVDIPELLERTYRTSKNIGIFKVTSSKPQPFMGSEGILFTYDYVDGDELTRRGEAIATLKNGALYMISFDAPRIHYFEKNINDYRSLVTTAKLN